MKNIIYKIARKVYYLLPIPQSKREELYKKREQKNEYQSLSFEDTYKKLCKYDIISFDIFDTLITRSIYEPDDVFILMGETLKIDSFLEKRKKAETDARSKLSKDVNLSEIYASYSALNNISIEEAKNIQKLEEEIELKLTIPRKDMLQLVKNLYENNKNMIIVSDMYLEKSVILKMLKKCGYDKKMFKDIHISNDINKRKDTKEIWPYIKTKYPSSKIIHIGDNDNSDVNNPKEYKIDTLKVMSSKELLNISSLYASMIPYIEKRTVSDSLYLGTIMNKKIFNSPFSNLKINTIEDFGYSFHGPMLNEFLKFMVDKTQNMDELLFLAREGYYLQKLYNDYIDIYGMSKKDNVYFLASRKSTYTATIYDENDINKLIDKEFSGTFKNFMNQLFDINVEDESEIKLPKDLDLVKEKIKPFIKEILKNSTKERKAYLNYVKQTVKQYNKKDLAIIDLGYSGTIQYNLTRLLEQEMTGIYLTNSSNVKKFSKNSKLLFCFDINQNEYYKNIFYYSLILEFLLSAPYGQLQRFEMDGKLVKPVYNNEKMDKTKKQNIQKIYKEVKSYIKDMQEISTIYNININQDLIVTLYTTIVDSKIINQSVKDHFDFMDSFDASEVRNVFKIISKY